MILFILFIVVLMYRTKEGFRSYEELQFNFIRFRLEQKHRDLIVNNRLYTDSVQNSYKDSQINSRNSSKKIYEDEKKLQENRSKHIIDQTSKINEQIAILQEVEISINEKNKNMIQDSNDINNAYNQNQNTYKGLNNKNSILNAGIKIYS